MYSDAKEVVEEVVGKTIVDVDFNEDGLFLLFEYGIKVHIYDNGQSCCEHRYIVCDDDVSSLIGQKFKGIEEKECSDISQEDDYDVHDIMFVEVQTFSNSIALVTHNEHNGYYGGFILDVKYVK